MAEVSDLKIKLVGMEKEQSEYEEKQNKAEVSFFRLFSFFFFPIRVCSMLSYTWVFELKSACNRILHIYSTVCHWPCEFSEEYGYAFLGCGFFSSLSLCFKGCCLALIKTQSPFQQHTVFLVTLSFPGNGSCTGMDVWSLPSLFPCFMTEKYCKLSSIRDATDICKQRPSVTSIHSEKEHFLHVDLFPCGDIINSRKKKHLHWRWFSSFLPLDV